MLAYQAGDVAAFDQLMLRNERRVWAFVRRFVLDGATADDLLQEVFLRVVRGAVEWKGEAKVSTWIFTIARHVCIDHARAASQRPRAASIDAPVRPGEDESGPILRDRIAGPAAGGEHEALNQELRTSLDRAIDALPPEQKEVFLMRELMDMSYAEIAAAVGDSEMTVNSRMRYALRKLREALGAFHETKTAPSHGGR
jgi:RNA polymerase sigma-70 factor (ECF subfamily)